MMEKLKIFLIIMTDFPLGDLETRVLSHSPRPRKKLARNRAEPDFSALFFFVTAPSCETTHEVLRTFVRVYYKIIPSFLRTRFCHFDKMVLSKCNLYHRPIGPGGSVHVTMYHKSGRIRRLIHVSQ